jgi:hypothetical protein
LVEAGIELICGVTATIADPVKVFCVCSSAGDALPTQIIERKKGKATIKKQFCDIYSMFKTVRQEVEEVCILLSDEKTLIDKKFSTHPFMFSQELYNYWNKEIRSIKVIIGYEAFEHRITLFENLKLNEGDAVNKTIGVYRIPKVFITKFLEEYDKKSQRVS